ncbi:uncharacterized protein LOC127129638 [Lathyrus oleraceus]|uniref:uncharacterized protein LOC127129638 n=1 Tax=Pisum sativum TaxID=3888 RepID=UPI0021D36734|nr:uncharacterized protein LOC127129638 [Pisum sativum]
MSLPQFLIKAEVYFNGASPPVEFRLPNDTTSLASLISKLNELLLDTETMKVRKIEFHKDWIDTDVRVKYNLIEFMTDEDVKEMWRSFFRMITKWSIELYVRLSRSVDDIMEMLKRQESSGSV